MLDGSQPLSAGDEAAIRAAETAQRLIVLVNKSDLPRALDMSDLADRFDHVISISAKGGMGLEALESAVAALFPQGETPAGEILTNARQAQAVERAAASLRGALQALDGGLTPDAALTDVEEAMSALGELTGRTIRSDLVERIFSRFCVGK